MVLRIRLPPMATRIDAVGSAAADRLNEIDLDLGRGFDAIEKQGPYALKVGVALFGLNDPPEQQRLLVRPSRQHGEQSVGHVRR